MNIIQRTIWRWNSPVNEGYRILLGLVFWGSIFCGGLCLALLT